MNHIRLHYLFDRWIGKTYTPEEKQELFTALRDPKSAEILRQISEQLTDIEFKNIELKSDASDSIYNSLRVIMSAKEDGEPAHSPSKVHFLRSSWLKYAAAVILVLGLAAYFWNNKALDQNVTSVPITIPVQNDIAPGGNKAILTLADGSTIVLDDAHNGTLAEQGNSSVVKLADGQVVYKQAGKNSVAAQLHTMSTPRGGQYQLGLPDGTRIWLNAASSITYPTVFTADERRVSVTGEVYFEVAKDKAKPFIVTTSKQTEIHVLGTHFNVNDYALETSGNITLVEGSVMVKGSTLKPGEAYVNGSVVKADVEEAIAWKEGRFQFNDADIETIMDRVMRWYDVEVIYEGKVSKRFFSADISMKTNLSVFLKVLEESNIRFRLEGRKLFVKA